MTRRSSGWWRGTTEGLRWSVTHVHTVPLIQMYPIPLGRGRGAAGGAALQDGSGGGRRSGGAVGEPGGWRVHRRESMEGRAVGVRRWARGRQALRRNPAGMPIFNTVDSELTEAE